MKNKSNMSNNFNTVINNNKDLSFIEIKNKSNILVVSFIYIYLSFCSIIVYDEFDYKNFS